MNENEEIIFNLFIMSFYGIKTEFIKNELFYKEELETKNFKTIKSCFPFEIYAESVLVNFGESIETLEVDYKHNFILEITTAKYV